MKHLNSYVRPFPGVVRIEPSGACNLACSHCPTGTVSMSRGIMPPAIFDRVLASLERNRDQVRVAVLYHGGEPLLNQRFAEMAGRLKQIGIPFVKTVSNGMLWTEEVIPEIVASGLDAVEFSLDGESPEENDATRRKGSFNAVAANIRRLIAYKREHGVAKPDIYLSSTRILPEGGDASMDPEPPAYLLREFSMPGAVAGFKCTWAMQWPQWRPSPDLYQLRGPQTAARPAAGCDHVDNTVTINWNGDVLACCYDLTCRQILGSVKLAELEDIWNGPYYLEMRMRMVLGEFPPLCQSCNVVRPPVFLMRQTQMETA
jgi:MoaA/NifB/PqqE/SkfB family radical SAM enzyme